LRTRTKEFKWKLHVSDDIETLERRLRNFKQLLKNASVLDNSQNKRRAEIISDLIKKWPKLETHKSLAELSEDSIILSSASSF
jgi:hypothetical protein